MIRKATNIGTTSVLNHISARSIKDITGVDIIKINNGFIKESTTTLTPMISPTTIPARHAARNATSHLASVANTTGKKDSDFIIEIRLISVVSGDGRIISEFIAEDAISHTIIKKSIETSVTKLLFIVEIFIR